MGEESSKHDVRKRFKPSNPGFELAYNVRIEARRLEREKREKLNPRSTSDFIRGDDPHILPERP